MRKRKTAWRHGRLICGVVVFAVVTVFAATGMADRGIRDLLQARAHVTGTYTCPGYSGIDSANPVTDLRRDTFTWGDFGPAKVGDGKGDIDWRLNPYKNPSWYMWLHSLRWLGLGISAASKGDRAALAHVTAIVEDWVHDNPYSWKNDVGAYESTMHRTNVLICTRQAILSGLRVPTLPAGYSWLDKALVEHAKFLIKNYSGDGNHGTDEALALFGVGCTLNRPSYLHTAESRLTNAIKTAIDSAGSTNEQSTAYAQFNYTLWGRAEAVLKQCGADPGTTISKRRALMANWLALATNSLGRLHQIGDSEAVKTMSDPGTPLEYAASLGTKGVAPTQRIGIFDAGYVFGRTGWGQTRPFSQESTYSIRFGPAREKHGHNDHMAITYTSRGREILVDGGHAGYQTDKWRAWARSQAAHNSLTTPMTPDRNFATTLKRSRIEPDSEFYEFTDQPGTGIDRTRGVLVLKDPDLLVVLDQATSTTPQQFQTLWHLPDDQNVTVRSPTTAVAKKPGGGTQTFLFQIPYRQQLPTDAIQVEKGESDPVQGWHYPDIFTRKPAPTVMFNRSGQSATILSVIAPVKTSQPARYTARRAGSTLIVDLNIDGHHTSIGVTPGGTLHRLT
ncbi:heparinase II/III family protein [Kribbella sp. VKM Ac-2568]|uniref:heparinase II/III domain-containing protein n=1 Tax=Kribbella sp. VKM Ac-2568 TaxID=2512219 RepID=UPI0010DCBFBE|nr:heparinase II/III family protein [Kribbella sp. VKM Ac-2568]TCM36974.1 heparinase II/III-like protein [Kribbella sp. VKM Ac-2568]